MPQRGARSLRDRDCPRTAAGWLCHLRTLPGQRAWPPGRLAGCLGRRSCSDSTAAVCGLSPRKPVTPQKGYGASCHRTAPGNARDARASRPQTAGKPRISANPLSANLRLGMWPQVETAPRFPKVAGRHHRGWKLLLQAHPNRVGARSAATAAEDPASRRPCRNTSSVGSRQACPGHRHHRRCRGAVSTIAVSFRIRPAHSCKLLNARAIPTVASAHRKIMKQKAWSQRETKSSLTLLLERIPWKTTAAATYSRRASHQPRSNEAGPPWEGGPAGVRSGVWVVENGARSTHHRTPVRCNVLQRRCMSQRPFPSILAA